VDDIETPNDHQELDVVNTNSNFVTMSSKYDLIIIGAGQSSMIGIMPKVADSFAE
jgi:hypothetical protein